MAVLAEVKAHLILDLVQRPHLVKATTVVNGLVVLTLVLAVVALVLLAQTIALSAAA
jgi:hypothetical protein